MTQTEAEIAHLMALFNPLEMVTPLDSYTYEIVYHTKEYQGLEVKRGSRVFDVTVWAKTNVEADQRLDAILLPCGIPFSCAKLKKGPMPRRMPE